MTGELSRGNELSDPFWDTLLLFQENTLQDGHELSHSFPDEPLQGKRDMQRNS